MTVEGDDDGGDRWNKLMTSRWAAGKKAVGVCEGGGWMSKSARPVQPYRAPRTAGVLFPRHYGLYVSGLS